MLNSHHQLSDSDIDTLIMTLSILPSLGLEESDIQANINLQCCRSAIEHLADSESFRPTPNEMRVMYASLEAAQLINRGLLSVDSETKIKCSKAMFTINKLYSYFDSLKK